MPHPRLAPLALLLALLLPGLGGSWLSLGHRCPSAIAAGQQAPRSNDAHQHHDDDHSAPSHHDGQCHCLGACQGSSAPLAPQATNLEAAVVVLGSLPVSTGAALSFPGHVPLDLLPPATAPPAVL